MATLAELYEFLETKQDDSHLDSRFSYDAFLPVEQPKARLEILTWWKIERLIEDENCNFDKNFIVSYFDERVKATNNQLLKYRYNYFISLLTNDNRYAKQSIDALIAVINTLLPKDKEDYPHVAEKAIEVLMSLIKRVKYKIPEATDLIWGVLESDYGYRTKMVCIRLAKEKGFFPSRDAKKIVCLCKDLLSLVKDSWRENCCELGLFYSSKIQGEAKPYMNFFYEALGDMEMGQLVDPATAPNNIAIPWMNEDHSQKAMAFYQKAGLTQKRNRAELAFRENKKKMVMLHFKIEKKTDKKIVEYFGNLEKELLEGKLSWLLENLSCPVRFLFPSYEQIRLRMSASKSTVEKLGFENKIMDINGNSKDAGKDFDLRQKYGIWLMNIVRNTVINMILTAVNIKQLTYSKLRKWFLKNTCFGIQLEYTRSGQVVTTTWFSQIDYGVEALIKQYNRFLQGKPTDWRLPVDILSIRFEGILRDMVGDYGGCVTKVGRDNSISQALLDTMTLEELIREIKTDFSEVKGRWKNYVRKFRKTAQKRTMFPWLWEANIKTRRFNEWYISFYAESKKEVGILNPTFTMLFKYKGQLLVGAVTNDVVLIFTGHFFDRYKERFFKIHKDSRPVTNREIMKVFFLFNSNYCFYSKEKEENVRGYCYDGMLLGDWIGEEGGFVKTFISRQEMKMNQFVEYFEFF